MYTSSSQDKKTRLLSVLWLRHFITRAELSPMILDVGFVQGEVVGVDFFFK
jgi:hypothetical protein